MQPESTALFPKLSPKSGVYVADGYGVRIYINRRHLVVADGIGRQRREQGFARATAGIRRLIVLGHEGFVSLEALRWIADLGIAFLQIDRDGRVLATSAINGLDDGRLRRAQALAGSNGTGIELARTILREKLAGQLSVLEELLNASTGNDVADCLGALESAVSLDQLRATEASAALAYWRAWEKVEVPFARKDLSQIPDHWRVVGPRRSPVSGTPRLAGNPAHAMLNYLYALAEAETRLACLSMGLDPGLGFVHTDTPNRDSLVLDVMEVLRPEVDAYVLRLIRTRVFSMKDFYETPRGSCRILAPLTYHLAQTMPLWARKVGPVVEDIAGILSEGRPRTRALPTRLTQANRKAGRDLHRRRQPVRSAQEPRPPAACRTCGEIMADSGRTYCDACIPGRKQEQVSDMLAKSLRSHERSKAHGGEAAKKRGRTNSRRLREAAAWDQAHSRPDPEVFSQEILPALQRVPIRALMKATGLSSLYCSEIRRGLKVPHPRHWEAMRQAAGFHPENGDSSRTS